jgi:hypothetical protein
LAQQLHEIQNFVTNNAIGEKPAQQRDIFVTPFVSLDTNLPDHFDVGEAHHDLLHAVHLQGTHAAFDKSHTNLATRP